MRSKAIGLSLVLLAALAVPAASTGDAQSHRAKAGSGCPDKTLCVWAKPNYRGQRVKITRVGHTSNKLARKMNNEASSLKNRFAKTGLLYDKKDAGPGDAYGFCDMDKLPDLGAFDGKASSSVVGSTMMRTRRICKRKGIPASRSASNKTCPKDAFCLWAKAGYKGKRVKITKVDDVDNKLFNKMNDKASSAKNRWKFRADIFADVNGEGEARCFSSGGKVRNLAGSYDFDDIASSAYLHPIAAPCF